jgi:hypothetical protein
MIEKQPLNHTLPLFGHRAAVESAATCGPGLGTWAVRRRSHLTNMKQRNVWTITAALVGALLVLSLLLCWLLRPLLMIAAGTSEADYQTGKPGTHMIYWRAMQCCVILAGVGALLHTTSRYLWHRRHRDAALLGPTEA